MAKNAKIYTVSQINTLVKTSLEDSLPSRVCVTGEITGWKIHQSGHCYFTIKDENSQLPCVIWKSDIAKLKYEVENGLAVVAKGHIDVFVPQGKYQFYVDSIQPAGVGSLQLAFEQMVKKLQGEGLFEESHKKALPKYPMRIGVLTSESGAAIHDITDSIWNRWPVAKILLYPVAVQGDGAGEEIALAVRDVNRRNAELCLDILIVGRGGGSLEDLWAFNEEVLARAIFESKIPVISAVGHEVDVTVCDLVADARAATPTKAAIIAVPDAGEVFESLDSMSVRIAQQMRSRVELSRGNLKTILASSVFRNPLLSVNYASQKLDEKSSALRAGLEGVCGKLGQKLDRFAERVASIEPHRILREKTVRLNGLENLSNAAVKNILNKANLRLTASENRLGAMNPKAVLKRGYSITKNKRTGKLVTSVSEIKTGDLLITELSEKNLVESQVTKTQNMEHSK